MVTGNPYTLPEWVWDAVDAMEKWHDEHAPLYQQDFYGFSRTDGCGCNALDKVPHDIRNAARIMRNRLRNSE